MSRPTAFVKLPGNLFDRKDVLGWLKEVAQSHHTVICVGGGIQINSAFANAGFTARKQGPLGREITGLKERQLARNTLEINRTRLEESLAAHNISATVVIPAIYVGSVLCPLNGDAFVRAAYLGFDQLYILTLKNRAKKKIEEVRNFPKIEVVEFP